MKPYTSTFIPDWNQKYRTKEGVEVDLEIKYEGPGWYVNGKDQAFIFEEDGWWYVAMYNNVDGDVREIFRQIGYLPIIKVK